MAEYKARLCCLRKWTDFNGYGFNLHAEKGKAGQYIGSVDADSPAVAAGLKKGDRIIEVNGVNIGSENHQQVVSRIKSVANETKLLVVDPDTDQFFKSHNIVITGESDDVTYLEAPLINPFKNLKIEEEEEERSDFTSSTSQIEQPKEPPRLCILRRWPDFDGYGFNLHSEKDRPGQFIGKVDAKSPAECSGLRKGDWIVEINGDNVMSMLHHDVVTRIKSNPNEVSMLVVDSATQKFYKERGIVINSSLDNVEISECPYANPVTGKSFEDNVNGSHDLHHTKEKRNSRTTNDSDHSSVDGDFRNSKPNQQPYDSQHQWTYAHSPSHISTSSYSASTVDSSAGRYNGGGSVSSDFSGGHGSVSSYDNSTMRSSGSGETGIFAGSAKEARERMKRKTNVKDAGMTTKDKYLLFQQL